MPSNVFERWLISSTDMPTPGRDTRSRCASSSTGIGKTAGPAEKLNTRCVVVAIWLSRFYEYQLNHVRQQTVSELRFEPRRFRRHDAAGVGDAHQVVDRNRMHREGDRELPRIDELLELPRTANAANEVNPLVGADVGDPEQRLEYRRLQ